MTVEIKRLTLGIAATNCYIIGDTETGEAVLIDPVDNATLLYETAHEAGWEIKLILATHGHYDHILVSRELKMHTGAQFYIHKNAPQVSQPDKLDGMLSQLFPLIATPDVIIDNDPMTICLANIQLETRYTPGHAPGHVCYFLRDQKVLLGGDCLFAGSIGRTDFPFCDTRTLMESIFQQILPLGDDVQILPGHMGPTTIGHERLHNPFLIDYAKRKG